MGKPAQPRVLLGVGGGIAAYKAAEIVRRLQDRGFRVQATLTAAAQRFITPLTFAALTQDKVVTELFEPGAAQPDSASAIEHIEVPLRADAFLVAPATADLLAKLAHGLADDFLTTAHLAYQGPLLVAPAMNVNMWNHPATQANLAVLRGRGVHVIEPDEGAMACGMYGPGRLAEPDAIAAEVERVLEAGRGPRDLEGLSVLITAGPTREPVDPVRYISNRSSGRMGFALAAEALRRGARVRIVRGPVALEPPAGAEAVAVETAAEMRQAVLERLPSSDLIIMAAAVADYRPRQVADRKIKKSDAALAIELEPTQDILAELGRLKGDRVLVGFAAETNDLEAHGLDKLRRKGCDFLVANPVGDAAAGAGMDSEENQGLLLGAAGERIELPREGKAAMARRIFDGVAPALARRKAHV
ncbi:MAG: bifunctional phosphopantothenoylcysteine decarboxylase/phosphopantothenate--cysteine ligase CoaBC [Acidobacteria bacterium]|nr:bifunctional phosphopantothenoylcysteine decarboxylase/phosphopantothenate--cysteine ligase CoaBC [Acidobacteriota bacterium]